MMAKVSFSRMGVSDVVTLCVGGVVPNLLEDPFPFDIVIHVM